MGKGTRKKRSQSKTNSENLPPHLQHINQKAAGIDIGSKLHFVSVPEGCDEVSVRAFKSFTADLHELVAWLKKCAIETIAMESTGVYWIPLYELLESAGFDVKLVDARHVKNVSGRKTDVLDCQWLQQLHTYGLLQGAFRPQESICALRAYLRQRHMLIESAAAHIQHMQKALSQMNLQLHNVISDITGTTGMAIIRDIAAGVRDPKTLAKHRDPRCRNSIEIIEKSLQGYYRDEHVFALTQALELYDAYREKMKVCDEKIENQLALLDDANRETSKNDPNSREASKKRTSSKIHSKNTPAFDLTAHLIRITGVDLTAIPGIEAFSALKIISEIGLDLSRWKSPKQFASWLGLCPGNNVSGGKHLSGKTKRTSNQAAHAFRMAASTLYRNQTALGAFLRRLKSRLGAPKAITATAHKLAIIFYNMLKNGTEYVEAGIEYYEKQYRDRLIKNLDRRAKELGYSLVQLSENSVC